MISALLASALLLASPSRLDEVVRLYRDFEYERALEKISAADSGDVDFALMEGILCAELNKKPRAIRAFRRALEQDPSARLPFEVAPKVSELFKQAQEQQQPEPPLEVAVKDKRTREPKTAVAPREYKIKAGLWGLAEPIGRSMGVGVNAGAEWRQFEGDVRLSFGKQLGVGLNLAYLFDLGRFRPKAGLRGWVFPSLGAGGGGPVLGAELRVYEGFYLTADAALELYALSESASRPAVVNAGICGVDAPPDNCYRRVGVALTLGAGYAF